MEPHANHGSKPSVSRRAFLAGAAAAGGAAALGTASVLSAAEGPSPGSAPEAPFVPKRPFGRTGTQISVVGLGCGSRFYTSIPDDESAAELLRRAIEGGMEFVETSANYGPDGMSERRIGLAMKTHRSKVFLETKVDERTYDGAMREIERSLTRMNTGYLDLLLHHNMLEGEVDKVLGPQGAERALREMADQKVVRFRGLSTHFPHVALDGMARLDPDGIQLPINATRVPDFEADVLPRAQERGVAVIAMKTVGHGYFLPANATLPDRIEQYGPPKDAFDRWDRPTPREYIHYALSLPIAAATVGVDSHFTLDGVLAAAQDFTPLDERARASVTERAQVFATTGYWVPTAAVG
ncbi:MAG: aldo/keto reductase [Gemmatimonadetes bacterium]|nr:aldo/keto reductase [Gemmatimonadota bacterium]